jgi:peptide chain release factor 2
MIQIDQIKSRLSVCRKMVDEIGDAFHIDDLKRELEELNLTMAEPGFWDDADKAQNTNKKAKSIENKLKKHKSLETKCDDIEVLIEFAIEDSDMEEELESEINTLEKDCDKTRLSALLTGQYDANNAILSLNAGAGGTEAQDWTDMLFRMYKRWCERQGFEVKVMDYLAGNEAGIKSVTILAQGENAYGFLKAEKGVHRLVRISPFDSSARRHTSFASVDVMPEVSLNNEVEIPQDEIKMDVFHASGAGGQHINKTSSAVRLTHIPTGLVASCQNERSQVQNREMAMRMLIAKLVEIKEREHMEKMAEIKGEMKKIEWGSQIRSYVFHPYKMAKDHRTGVESNNMNAVMDGDIDRFINGYLKMV